MTTRSFITRIAYGAASIHTRAALEAARTAHEDSELDAWIQEIRHEADSRHHDPSRDLDGCLGTRRPLLHSRE